VKVSPQFLHQLGVASVLAGAVFIIMAAIAKRA